MAAGIVEVASSPRLTATDYIERNVNAYNEALESQDYAGIGGIHARVVVDVSGAITGTAGVIRTGIGSARLLNGAIVRAAQQGKAAPVESRHGITPMLQIRLSLIPDDEFRAVNQLPINSTGKVEVLDVGTFRVLDKAKIVGDKITPDHQPSAAAVTRFNKAKAAQEGRVLTAAEKRQAYREGIAIAIPESVHRAASRTFGGRNSKGQIQSDSGNLARGAGLDQIALRQALIDSGYDADAVDAAFRQRDRLNAK